MGKFLIQTLTQVEGLDDEIHNEIGEKKLPLRDQRPDLSVPDLFQSRTRWVSRSFLFRYSGNYALTALNRRCKNRLI
jgi:hypothetical protein